MTNPEYRNLNASQIRVLKKYDRKYGDGHGHIMVKDFDGNENFLDEHDVNQWYITI